MNSEAAPNPRLRPSAAIRTFSHDGIRLRYSSNHHVLGLAETCLLNVYRCDTLPIGGLVIDCGAGIGDYTVLASRRIGPEGLVLAIEPDPKEFELLQENVANNSCSNVISFNLGIGGHNGKRSLVYFGREISFGVRTLGDIVGEPSCKRFQEGRIAAVKIDIEGFEAEAIQGSFRLFERVERVPIELHGTKTSVDQILLPQGFHFVPFEMHQARQRILATLLRHPLTCIRVYAATRQYRAHTTLDVLGGRISIAEGNEIQVGEYVR
jgi:FkbM family methyltransferase